MTSCTALPLEGVVAAISLGAEAAGVDAVVVAGTGAAAEAVDTPAEGVALRLAIGGLSWTR